MKLRAQCDAILVGAETVRQDDPALTLRGPDIPEGKQQPWRVVLTRGVMQVLIEGGGTVLAAAFSERLVHEIVFYTAPLISGSGRPVVDSAAWDGGSVALQFLSAEMIGADLKLRVRTEP